MLMQRAGKSMLIVYYVPAHKSGGPTNNIYNHDFSRRPLTRTGRTKVSQPDRTGQM